MTENTTAPSSADGPSQGRQPLAVLVADTQALFAQALGRTLARHPDLEVVEPYPRSGVDATQAAVILRPDVAVLDFWLAGVTAVAATRTIVGKSPDTKVVVLGWFHHAEDIGQILEAGACGFVSKERPLHDVVEAIRLAGAGKHVVIDPSFRVAVNMGEPTSPGDERHVGSGEAFTPRELQVLRLLGAGLPVEDVAARLDITRKTAQTHLSRILAKTGTNSQLQALAAAREQGYLI